MVLTGSDVAKHGDEKSCWVIIHVSVSLGRWPKRDEAGGLTLSLSH